MSYQTGQRHRLPFFSNCVDWPDNRLDVLRHLVDEGAEITRETFFQRVRRDEIPPDWYPHKRYWGHGFYTLRRQHVYWYTHSSIEFVFADPDTIEAIHEEIR